MLVKGALGVHLNINTLSYQYRNSHFIIGILIQRKTDLILKCGPYHGFGWNPHLLWTLGRYRLTVLNISVNILPPSQIWSVAMSGTKFWRFQSIALKNLPWMKTSKYTWISLWHGHFFLRNTHKRHPGAPVWGKVWVYFVSSSFDPILHLSLSY